MSEIPLRRNKSQVPIRHSYVELNGSLVHLVQYGLDHNLLDKPCNRESKPGRQITETEQAKPNGSTSAQNQTQHEQVLVFFPGNPGILGVYHDFLMLLYDSFESQNTTAVLAISHNNFDHPTACDYPDEKRLNIELNSEEKNLGESLEPHHLELQVLNKLVILKRLLEFNPNCRLVFVGHSIGCYVILRILQSQTIVARHNGSILIHPALENLTSTFGGMIASYILRAKLDLAIKFILPIFPKVIKHKLVKFLAFRGESSSFLSEEAQSSLNQLLSKVGLNAVCELAKSEFTVVKHLDHNLLIKPHIEKLRVLYAAIDYWVTSSHVPELRSKYPDLHIEEDATAEHIFFKRKHTLIDYVDRCARFIKDFYIKATNEVTITAN